MKSKILLCTPCKGKVGGIIIWSNNIINYYCNNKSNSKIDLEILALNRKELHNQTNLATRIVSGVMEYTQYICKYFMLLRNNEFNQSHVSSSASFALFRDVAFVIISRLFNVKINIHFHFGRIPTIFKNKSWEYYILKWITNKANRVVVMDDLSYKTLLSHGISNVDNIPNPISPIIVNEVRKLSENCLREDKRILFVGHLIKTKGVFELINAMSRIKDYNLYLVGSTKDSTKARILQNLTDNNIDNVYLLDELSQEDVIKEMLKATIFILPSYSEGFPNVILESMICSCQIIATNVGAIPQMLNVNSDKIAGICIKPRSESEIINAIIHLGKNNNEANKIAKNAYERICDYYTVDKVWSKLEELWIS